MGRIFKNIVKVTSIVLTLAVLVGSMNQVNVNAASQKQKAKKAYAKILNNKSKTEDYVSYALTDIDKNGVPEMIYSTGNVIWELYTYRKGKIKKFNNGLYLGEWEVKYYSAKKRLLIYAGGTSDCYNVWTLKNGKLKKSGNIYALKHWKKSGSYSLRYYINDKRVSYKKYRKAMKKYSKTITFKQWNG